MLSDGSEIERANNNRREHTLAMIMRLKWHIDITLTMKEFEKIFVIG